MKISTESDWTHNKNRNWTHSLQWTATVWSHSAPVDPQEWDEARQTFKHAFRGPFTDPALCVWVPCTGPVCAFCAVEGALKQGRRVPLHKLSPRGGPGGGAGKGERTAEAQESGAGKEQRPGGRDWGEGLAGPTP